MLTINQHVCLFFIADSLPVNKQKEFFYRMSTALGYDETKAVSLSSIYAQYGIFDGTPVTHDEYASLKRLAPCKNCAALRKKPMYKGIPLLDNACSLCMYSTEYKNGRDRDEKIVLKYFMMPDKPYEYLQILPENAFTSLKRLGDDYALGECPIIPFHYYLYLFLEKNSIQDMGKDAFFESFLKYIASTTSTLFDIDEYRPYLQLCFDDIYEKISDKSVTDDVYALSAARLKQAYSYEPPQIKIKPVSAGSPEAESTAKKKRTNRKKKKASGDETQQSFLYETEKQTQCNNTENAEAAPQIVTVSNQEDYFIGDLGSMLSDMVKTDNGSVSPALDKPVISPSPEESCDITENTNSLYDTSDKTVLNEDVTDDSVEHDVDKDITDDNSSYDESIESLNTADTIPEVSNDTLEDTAVPEIEDATYEDDTYMDIMAPDDIPEDAFMENDTSDESDIISDTEPDISSDSDTVVSDPLLMNEPVPECLIEEFEQDEINSEDIPDIITEVNPEVMSDELPNTTDVPDYELPFGEDDDDPGTPTLDEVTEMQSDNYFIPDDIIIPEPPEITDNNSCEEMVIPNTTCDNPNISEHEPNISEYETNIEWSEHNILSYYDTFTIKKFSPEFENAISVLNRSETFEFLTELCKCSSISIETCIFHDRTGLLLYTSFSSNYYFYDIEVFGPDILSNALLNSEATVISYSPVPVMNMLNLALKNANIIHSIDAMYWLLNDNKEPKIMTILSEYCTTGYDKASDVNLYVLSHYHECFCLMNELLEQNNLVPQYHSMLRMFLVLSSSLDLHDIFGHRKLGFEEHGYLKYHFTFNWTNQLYKRGTVLRITIPGLDISRGFTPDSIASSVCLCFQGLHHTNKTHAHLISISSKALYVFYEGTFEQAMVFYDSIILRLQKSFFKITQQQLQSSTYCVIYE